MKTENIIECNGFKARIMEADRLTGTQSFALPPGKPLPVYKVSSFKKRPDTWMDVEGSVVVPVKSDKGLWFDWTLNDAENTAILPSVKGCNPLTGQQINGFTLESYKNKCPVHGTDLDDKLHCSECGFDWTPQNYVCSPNYLWLDGFKDKDGTVRQFFFTEDMARDIASHKLGKENTVPAFGFAFFKPKKKNMSVIYDEKTGTFRVKGTNSSYKMNVVKGATDNHHIDNWYMAKSSNAVGSSVNAFTCSTTGVQGMSGSIGTLGVAGLGLVNSKSRGITRNIPGVKTKLKDSSNVLYSCDSIPVLSKEEANVKYGMSFDNCCVNAFADSSINEVKEIEVAVGAGAVIEQKINKDTYGIETWKDVPDAIMRVYFVFEEEFNQWASHGFVGESDSMLKGLPVG